MDGEFNWNSGWPMGSTPLDTSSDERYMSALGSKGYMPAMSPSFFTVSVTLFAQWSVIAPCGLGLILDSTTASTAGTRTGSTAGTTGSWLGGWSRSLRCETESTWSRSFRGTIMVNRTISVLSVKTSQTRKVGQPVWTTKVGSTSSSSTRRRSRRADIPETPIPSLSGRAPTRKMPRPRPRPTRDRQAGKRRTITFMRSLPSRTLRPSPYGAAAIRRRGPMSPLGLSSSASGTLRARSERGS